MFQTHQTTLEILIGRFGGALLIKPVKAAPVLDMARQTLYNQVGAGTFPIQLLQTSAGKKIRVSDLADYIDSLQQITIAKPSKPSVKASVGRPNRTECEAAKQYGLSIREYRAQTKINLGGVQS